MNFSSDEIKRLAPAAVLLLALLAAGAGLIAWMQHELRDAAQVLAGARNDRMQAREKLTRIAEEEKEVRDKIAVYRELRERHVLGEERRLEWADAMARIRTQRELLDLRYLVDRRRSLSTVAGKTAGVEAYASSMKVDIALLHEGDLLVFLRDLRESGNAFYSVKRCNLTRTGQAPTGLSIVPRLRAECEIDLITIIDRAAKS